MSSMYCDRCGQVDESISISALRALDSGPQFSQSAGGIIHDGEYTPFLATGMSRDFALNDLQSKAINYTSRAKYKIDNGLWKNASCAQTLVVLMPAGMALVLGFWGLSMVMGPDRVFGYFLEGASVLLIVVTALLSARSKANPAKQANLPMTPHHEARLRSRENGSYCRRCNLFSPAH